MGFQASSGSVNATVVLTTSSTITGMSSITAQRNNSAGTSTLGTVGVGKKWKIINIQLTGCANTIYDEDQFVQLGGVTFAVLQVGANVGDHGNQSLCVPFNYECCPILAAGATVTWTTTANFRGCATVNYIEESA